MFGPKKTFLTPSLLHLHQKFVVCSPKASLDRLFVYHIVTKISPYLHQKKFNTFVFTTLPKG
jgi:hypothetical protein